MRRQLSRAVPQVWRRCHPFVLMYHSIGVAETDPYQITVSPPSFERQMQYLRDRGLRRCNMRELVDAQDRGCSAGLVGLTFDDGYTDFARNAVPTLRHHGFTATVFVVVRRLGTTNGWDSRGPRKTLMNAAQLRDVHAAGMEVASHSATHASLPEVAEPALRSEIADSRAELEDVLGDEVRGFAYPYGHLGPREVDAVRQAGYAYACAIWRSPQVGRHALPRAYVGERDGSLRLRAKELRHHGRARVAA